MVPDIADNFALSRKTLPGIKGQAAAAVSRLAFLGPAALAVDDERANQLDCWRMTGHTRFEVRALHGWTTAGNAPG